MNAVTTPANTDRGPKLPQPQRCQSFHLSRDPMDSEATDASGRCEYLGARQYPTVDYQSTRSGGLVGLKRLISLVDLLLEADVLSSAVCQHTGAAGFGLMLVTGLRVVCEASGWVKGVVTHHP